MSRSGAVIGAIVVSFLLQVLVAPHVAILGAVPSFPVLVVITLAIVEGPAAGAVSGFAAGLVLDFLGTGPVGAWALVLVVVGYAAGMLQENLFAEGWLQPLTVAVVVSVLAELSYLVLMAVLGSGAPFWRSVVSVVLPRGVYDVVLAVLFYPWLARVLHADQPVRSFRRIA